MKISVISPIYKLRQVVPEFVERVNAKLAEITNDYEIILVEDGCPERSWEAIQQACKAHSSVKGVKLSRNFGQHAAIRAGLEQATGDCCIVMDGDLQDDPADIAKLVEAWKQGHDVVFTRKESREHGKMKNLFAVLFNWFFNLLVSDKRLKADINIGAFSLLSAKAKQAFLRYEFQHYHYLMIVRELGFNSTFVPIKHLKRASGKSSYSLPKLIRHGVVGITYHSDKLLHFSIYAGILISLLSFGAGIYVITRYFISGFLAGWASTFVLILFALGVLLTSIGVLGLYLGKMFEQVKKKPIFILDEVLNKEVDVTNEKDQ